MFLIVKKMINHPNLNSGYLVFRQTHTCMDFGINKGFVSFLSLSSLINRCLFVYANAPSLELGGPKSNQVRWPSKLKSLSLGRHFDQSLEHVTFPSTLQLLDVAGWIDRFVVDWVMGKLLFDKNGEDSLKLCGWIGFA